MRVDEHTIEVAGTPVFYRSAPAADRGSAPAPDRGSAPAAGAASAPAPGGGVPLYLHGAPTSSDDWTELLERTGGVAPDLIGFGRSGKGGHLDYTLDGLADFLERTLSAIGVERVRLVAHDWGAGVGLVLAQRAPDRIERLVLCDPLLLLDGFSWPRVARWLRRPGAGELIMGSVPRWLFARTLRQACAHPEALSDERIAAIWDQFDQGTQRAVLRLHRSADESVLAAAGRRLEALTMPALVVWGERDPWFPAAFGDAYASRLGDATVQRVADAGHWPWLERPEIANQIAEFVER